MVQRLTLLAALLASTAAFGQELPNHSVAVGGGPGFVGFKSVGPCPANQVLGWTSPTQDPVCLTGGGGGGGGVSSINGILGPVSLVAGTNVTIVPGSPNAQSITISSTGGGGGGNPCPSPGVTLTGDVTTPTGSCVTTLATVNPTTGTYGAANAVAQITVNAKGLITGVTPVAISIPFTAVIGTLGCAQMPTITGDVGSAGGTCNLQLGAGVVTNAELANMPAATLKGNPTNAAAAPTDFTIKGLPNKPVPDMANDAMLIFDNTAGTLKYCLLNQCITGGGSAGVTSLNSLSGALAITAGQGVTITPSGANIQVGLNPTTNPTMTVLTTATSGTYNVPVGVAYIVVEMVGAGGGGSGGGSAGGGGTATVFGGYTAGPGTGGVASGVGGSPGSNTGTACDVTSRGGFGGGGTLSLTGSFGGTGGNGAGSFFGGGGASSYQGVGNPGISPGSGGGGGGANSTTTTVSGGAGGSGSYCMANIRSGLAASYSYTVGTGGVGQASSAAVNSSGAGANGMIKITEYYSAGGGSGGGGTAGVTSLNTLTGPLTIAPGTGIGVSQAGSTITVSNTAAVPTGFTTGDIKPTVKVTADAGWVMLGNDAASIGDASSPATVRANADTQSLFNLLWSVCPSDCTLTGGRGPDATTDWNAHKAILLPKTGGRALSGVGQIGTTGTVRAVGSTFGGEQVGLPTYSLSVVGSHTLTIGEIPDHSHATDAQYPWELIFYYAGGGGPYLNWDVLPGTGNQSFTGGAGPKEVGHTGGGASFSMSSSGTGTPNSGLGMFEPHAWVNWMIKL